MQETASIWLYDNSKIPTKSLVASCGLGTYHAKATAAIESGHNIEDLEFTAVLNERDLIVDWEDSLPISLLSIDNGPEEFDSEVIEFFSKFIEEEII